MRIPSVVNDIFTVLQQDHGCCHSQFQEVIAICTVFVQCRPYKILKGVSHVTIKVKERKQAGKSIAAAAAKELAPEAV